MSDYVLYFSETCVPIPTHFVLLDTDEATNNRSIEKIAKKLLEPHYDVKKLTSFVSRWANTTASENRLAAGIDGEGFTINVKKLENAREIMLFRKVTLENVNYLLCDVPFGMQRYEWDIHHQDHFPHRSRSSYRYVRPDGCTETAFYSSDLPSNVDIEKLEVVGLHSELKTTLTKKLVQFDTVGVFDHAESEFDMYVHKYEVPEGRDVVWLKIKK